MLQKSEILKSPVLLQMTGKLSTKIWLCKTAAALLIPATKKESGSRLKTEANTLIPEFLSGTNLLLTVSWTMRKTAGLMQQKSRTLKSPVLLPMTERPTTMIWLSKTVASQIIKAMKKEISKPLVPTVLIKTPALQFGMKLKSTAEILKIQVRPILTSSLSTTEKLRSVQVNSMQKIPIWTAVT